MLLRYNLQAVHRTFTMLCLVAQDRPAGCSLQNTVNKATELMGVQMTIKTSVIVRAVVPYCLHI